MRRWIKTVYGALVDVDRITRIDIDRHERVVKVTTDPPRFSGADIVYRSGGGDEFDLEQIAAHVALDIADETIEVVLPTVIARELAEGLRG